MKYKREFLPNLTDLKILVTVEYLNNLNLYPTHEGILKILKGVIDDETKELINCPTFQTILSYTSKQISRRVMMLDRYGFLGKKYDEKTDNLFITLTRKGEIYILEYFKKREKKFPKKQKVQKVTITKIDK